MNKIVEKYTDYMFDHGIISIAENKNEEQILTPTFYLILTNAEVLRGELPDYFTGKEQLQIITKIIKKAEKGNLILPNGQKNNTNKVGVFLFFFESWIASGESNIRPTCHPNRQTAICVLAGDVDGYYHGMQTVSACNGQSVVGDRELCQFDLNDNCSGRLIKILKDSHLKFYKMDDKAISKAIMELPKNE